LFRLMNGLRQMQINSIKKTGIFFVQLFVCFLIVLLTVFFGWEFFFRYTLQYGETGRYFDEENGVVHHEQAVSIYGLLFVSCLLTLAMMCRWILKTLRFLLL
jgi:hypothetical protein